MSNIHTSSKLTIKIEEASKTLVSIPNFVESVKGSMSITNQLSEMQSESKCTDASICSDYIRSRLEKIGIYSDDESHEILMSSDFTEKDARRVFCENGEPNLPVVRFKRVWSLLRDVNKDKNKEQATSFRGMPVIRNKVKALEDIILSKPIGQWKDKELITEYGTDCDTEIIRVLSERSNGRPFIIFSDEEKAVVDVEVTLRMLREARRRETPVNYQVLDVLKRLYAAGEFPNVFYIDSPFCPGTLLVDGYCDKSKLTWDGVEYECMQFARIAKECREVSLDKPSQKQFINTALQSGLCGLIQDYPETFLLYRELNTEDSLPNLKVRFSGKPETADPFVNTPHTYGNQKF